MKFLKFFAGATAACVVAGASGIAMAQNVNNCDDGSIWLTAVDEIVVDGRSCAIVNTVVSGNVTATNGATISLISSKVGGDVDVSGAGNAIIVGNVLYYGALRINENQNAIVQSNRAEGGSIVVNSNDQANVQGNVAENKVRCASNGSLVSSSNVAKTAVECP
jgi:hypothetical protein